MSSTYTIVIFIHGEAHPFKSLKKAEEFMKKMERKGIEYSTEADYDLDSSSSEYDSDCSTSGSGLETDSDSDDEETDSDSDDEETDSDSDSDSDSDDEDNDGKYTRRELKKKSIKELKKICDRLGIARSAPKKEEYIDRIIKEQRKSSPKKSSKKAPAKKKASAPREFTRRWYIDRIESLCKRKTKAMPSGL